MARKGAHELAERLEQAVQWVEATAIVLKEKEVGAGNSTNWEVTTGPLSFKPAEQFRGAAAFAALSDQYTVLDWEGVETEGDGRRTLVRWVSV
jgi:hypothetical protein